MTGLRSSFWGLLAVVLAMPPRHATAARVEGTVFVDRDDDGLLSAGDSPLAGVAVFLGISTHALTDSNGRYSLDVSGNEIAWVRVPDGVSPSPAWSAVTAAAGDKVVDFPLSPSAATGPVTFIHASDTHIGVTSATQNAAALRQALDMDPPPHFFTITGDITQANGDNEFTALRQALDGITVPFVPVVGNHDRYDGGANYRKNLGPTIYSFDSGGVHFVVLDDAVTDSRLDDVLKFLEKDLALVPAQVPVAAFIHAPPREPIVTSLETAGIDYLFSGHWHSNGFIAHGELIQVNTEPLVMGGIDFTPAGYRRIVLDGPKLEIAHHAVVEETVLAIMNPPDFGCVRPGRVQLIVAAETGGQVKEITARIDGKEPIPLRHAGGWTYVAEVDIEESSALTRYMTATLQRPSGVPLEVERAFCVGPAPPPPGSLPDWPQLQGGPAHHGYVKDRVDPPLRTLWARAVGGTLRGGAPVIASGRLVVPVVDLAGATRGGVVALDATTGAVLWELRSGVSVHNAPAIQDGTVVFGSADGMVHALDLDTGKPKWTYDLGEGLPENVSWLYASPTIADGLVYIGVQRHFAAIDLKTGRAIWKKDPSPNGVWLGSYSSAGVSGGIAIATFARGADGIMAWDAYDGQDLWRLPPPVSSAVNGSPVIDGDTAFFVNAMTDVHSVDLVSAEVRWKRNLVPGLNDWLYGVASTPALAHGRLFVPTQFDYLLAVEADDGEIAWKYKAGQSVIHPVHYRVEARAFPASPIVTGDLVWVGGADGVLRALDGSTGGLIWSRDLGVPIMSAPVASGRLLFIGTWDGTMHALYNAGDPLPPVPSVPGEDCGCRVGGRARPRPSALWVTVLGLLCLLRRGRRLTRLPVLVMGLAALGCNEDPSTTTTDAGIPKIKSPSLAIRVTDGDGGKLLPSTLILSTLAGERLRIGHLDYNSGADQDRGYCVLAGGVVGTWDGIVLAHGVGEIPVGTSNCTPSPAIPFGRYRLQVLRGIEFEIHEMEVDLGKDRGRVVVEVPMRRVFDPGPFMAADLHVHAEGSPDSVLPRSIRVITEAAAGIQVIGSSDHNRNGDFQAEIAELGMQDFVASIPGNEVSADLMHFNVFPVEVDPGRPNGGAPAADVIRSFSARQLFDLARGLPGRPLVQLNHPRLRWVAYFDTAGWNGEIWPPPMPLDIDALEVMHGMTTFKIPGDDRQERSARDFYTLMRNGIVVTALGNSDTHHLNGILAGLPRSYVRVSDPVTNPFAAEEFVDALRRRRVVATSGPWLDVTAGGVGPGDIVRAQDKQVELTIELRQASFVKATRVRLWIGGEIRRVLDMPAGATSFKWSGREALGDKDSWIGVDASGDEPLPVELTGSWLAGQGRGGLIPFAMINPILVDVDGDGRASLPRAQMGAMVDVPAPPPIPGREDRAFDCVEWAE